MSVPTAALTVRKTINVACSVEQAFETFTTGIARWWPLATHSVGDERARTAVFEAGVGGRIYEIWDDGSSTNGAPSRCGSRRRASCSPGARTPTARQSTEVEVRFASEGDGARVELEHRGWERLGEEGPSVRKSYETGWDTVLGQFRSAL